MSNQLFNSRIDFYKNTLNNNKGLIFLLPTIFGSITQIFALISIDYNISYLKFFSLSQLIPDSLYFLIVVLITLILDLVISFFLGQHIINYNAKRYNKSIYLMNQYEKKGDATVFSLIILFSILSNFFVLFFVSQYEIKKSSIFIDTPLFTFIAVVLLSISGSFLYITTYGVSKYKFYYILYTLVGIGSIFILHKNFLKNSSEMNNNANFIYVNKKVKKNLNVEDLNVLYFNDKYIFYNIIKKESNQIYIYKLENIFY